MSYEIFVTSSSAPSEVPSRHHVAPTQHQLDSTAVDSVSTLPTEDQAPVITDGTRTVKTSPTGDHETGYNPIYYYCHMAG
jgi:hypothetical protein